MEQIVILIGNCEWRIVTLMIKDISFSLFFRHILLILFLIESIVVLIYHIVPQHLIVPTFTTLKIVDLIADTDIYVDRQYLDK